VDQAALRLPRWRGLAARVHDPEDAKEWLLANDYDEAVEKYFGPIPEEEDNRGGRPAIGGTISTALGVGLLAAVDAYAEKSGMSRAETIRVGLTEWLTADLPSTVTTRDVATGQREISSRHPTLGAAVEELRKIQADDYDRRQNQGLPSHQARVEHDGRPGGRRSLRVAQI
jgi:hypothetical protein